VLKKTTIGLEKLSYLIMPVPHNSHASPERERWRAGERDTIRMRNSSGSCETLSGLATEFRGNSMLPCKFEESKASNSKPNNLSS
jgi:hypothetical protein